MLRRLFYISVPRIDGTQVSAIVHTSRRNNARDGITGVLVYTGAFFGQLLEGEADAVGRLLERIRSDGRHEDVRVRFDEEAEVRWFAQWSMGYCLETDFKSPFPALSPANSDEDAGGELRRYVKDLLYRAEAM